MSKERLQKFINNNWTWLVLVGFIIFALINILRHEMWRDEIQTWILANSSSSLAELFKNSQFERHPRMWHIFNFLMTRRFDNPIVLQLFHLSIASLSIFIFLRYSPFTKLQKLLFTFGYFPLYEYATISRDYSLGILFIFLLAALFPKRHQNYLKIAIVLFLMSQTTAWAMLFAICFAFILILEQFITGNELDQSKASIGVKLLAFGIFLGGVYLSLLQMRSPDVGLDNIYKIKIDPYLIGLVLETTWKSYFPIHNFSNEFWNSNIIEWGAVRLLFSFVILLLSGLLFSTKRLVLLFYVLGSAGIFAIMYQYHAFMYLRYSGHLFFVFIVSMWIAKYYKETRPKTLWVQNLLNIKAKIEKPFVLTILIAQLIAGISASIIDWKMPFTAAPKVAKYIKENGLKKLYMVGDLSEPASAVSGYLGKEMYYPRHDFYGTFMIFKNAKKGIKTREVIDKAREISQSRKEDILLVLNWQVNKNITDVKQIAAFEKSIVSDEKYYLHILQQNKSFEE